MCIIDGFLTVEFVVIFLEVFLRSEIDRKES